MEVYDGDKTALRLEGRGWRIRMVCCKCLSPPGFSSKPSFVCCGVRQIENVRKDILKKC